MFVTASLEATLQRSFEFACISKGVFHDLHCFIKSSTLLASETCPLLMSSIARSMPVLGCRLSDTDVTPRSKLIACFICSIIDASSIETVSCVILTLFNYSDAKIRIFSDNNSSFNKKSKQSDKNAHNVTKKYEIFGDIDYFSYICKWKRNTTFSISHKSRTEFIRVLPWREKVGKKSNN